MNSKSIFLSTGLFTLGYLCAEMLTKSRKSPTRLEQKEEVVLKEAACRGIAEIETAKLAMQKSLSFEVKNFAQHMIDEHTSINQILTELAEQKGIRLVDDAELVKKSNDYFLDYNESEAFDEVYIKHQVKAHEDFIKLLQDAISTLDDQDIKHFLQSTSERLTHHLEMAKKLREGVKNQSLAATPSVAPEYDRIP